ncbi:MULTISPECIES: CAP domain-containing protein [Altibacter]|uniref:CAP domain-containing protein n=1 Tax=Altibacter TaxID=1535231 RepID=UPI0005506A42|nr:MULTISPECIES: CAP domain-containing protein [Altibacter]MCW9037297.1 CAP domain-containing protein [Altibacter sp.]
MNLLKTGLLAMAFVCFATSCQKDEGVAPEEINYSIDLNLAQETDWVMAEEILDLINAHRRSIGLSDIQKDQQYASAYAVDHTQYMIDIEQINHDNFGIRSQALKQRGAQVVGENVAYGYETAASVVSAWLNSESHRNIIEGNYTHSGFGVMQSDKGRYYFTQLFYRK